MRLALESGNNEHVYRVGNEILVEKEQPFIIKTLLKTNLDFAEKKEILEKIGFSKQDTLLSYQNLNIYNSALLNVPVYTNDIYLHRNEIKKPSKSLDELMFYLLSKNEIDLNKVPYDEENSILKMLVVFGLSKTLDKALSLMSEQEKEIFLNDSYIDINTAGLSNRFSGRKNDLERQENLMILPVIGQNEDTLYVMCNHGLNVNTVNKYTGRGLGFYLNDEKVIQELENKYGFIYDLKQRDFSGNLLKTVLKNSNCNDNSLPESPIGRLASSNSIINFIDARIAKLPLSNQEMFYFMLASFKDDGITNFKNVYNDIAHKINWMVPNTDIDILIFLSAQINRYSAGSSTSVPKLLYVKKDFEKRNQNFDSGLFTFNILTSVSHYSIKENNKTKLIDLFNENKNYFSGKGSFDVLLSAYEFIEKIINTKNNDYIQNLSIFNNGESFKEITGFNIDHEIAASKINLKEYEERIEKIINVSLVYEEKMFDYINDLLRQTNSTNKDLFKNTTAFKQHSHALYRAREEVSQNKYINLCGEYLQQNPEFKDYIVKVINNSMDNIKNSELKNLCEKEQFMALIEKEILNFSLKTQQQNIKSKNRL